MRSIVGLWRWRGNPLYRRSDRREALLALSAVILVVIVTPLAVWLGASAAHDTLLKTVAEQQRSRHQVWATAQSAGDRAQLHSDPESAAQQPGRRHVVARWAGPDGSGHRRTVTTRHRVRPGERFLIWTDGHGTPTTRPLSPQTASSYAGLAGLVVGAGAAGAMEAGRRLTMRQLLRRRYAMWDAEWARIGPDWGRTGSNS